jgi:hypothetical protein
MNMKIRHLLPILLFFADFESIHAQIIVQPSFSVGKSAFYFFQNETIKVGYLKQPFETATGLNKLPFLDYKFGILFNGGKNGMAVSKTRFFDADTSRTFGSIAFRSISVAELSTSFLVAQNRFLETYISTGVCSRKGVVAYYVKSPIVPDVPVDAVRYESLGISNRIESKYHPVSWLFLSANFGVQFYFKQDKSTYKYYKSPRFQLMFGLAVGTELNLTFKKRP